VAEGTTVEETAEEARAQAIYHQSAMVERRNIGLRIVVGIVGFDLLVLKLALDASESVTDHSELAWAVRAVAAGAFAVLTGMLIQIESRNRTDRKIYIAASSRADAIRKGGSTVGMNAEDVKESLWKTVKNSWATTWTLLGVLFLTVTICLTAPLFSDHRPPPTVSLHAHNSR